MCQLMLYRQEDSVPNLPFAGYVVMYAQYEYFQLRLWMGKCLVCWMSFVELTYVR